MLLSCVVEHNSGTVIYKYAMNTETIIRFCAIHILHVCIGKNLFTQKTYTGGCCCNGFLVGFSPVEQLYMEVTLDCVPVVPYTAD